MRLSELIVGLDENELRELVFRIVPGAPEIDRDLWGRKLELVLAQTGHVEEVIVARRPPVASILLRAVESEDRIVDLSDAKKAIKTEVDDWCRKVSSGELASRVTERSLIYRRMLEAAWRNDLVLDESEVRMLRMLREELGLLRIEHFLLAHHVTIQPFWRGDDAIVDVLTALAEDGVMFSIRDGVWALPDELVPHVRRALGVHLSRDAARRLFEHMDSRSQLKSALADHDLPTSGSKAERIERLVTNFVPPQRVVDTMHIFDARDLARNLGLHVSGPKDDLVQRIVDHFAAGGDLLVDDEEDEFQPLKEERVLDRRGFETLFLGLKGHQLQRLLMAFELHHSGTKEVRVASLWESPYSERTLLGKLKNPDLEELLRLNGLDRKGPKTSKIERLLEAVAAESAGSGEEAGGAGFTVADEEDAGIVPELEGLLADIDLSSKSTVRFDVVRDRLAVQLEIEPGDVGVKYLGDPKNYRNRIGEALRVHPSILLLLVSHDEGDAVLEATRARLAMSSDTIFVTLLLASNERAWAVGDILCVRETNLLARVSRLLPDADIQIASLPIEAQDVQVKKILAEFDAQLSVQWSRVDLAGEVRVRRAVLRAFDRVDTVIRTKHISEGRNIGNRISEGIGAGCEALVLVIPKELEEAARLELGRQLSGGSRTVLAIVLVEKEDGDYAEPIVIGREALPDA